MVDGEIHLVVGRVIDGIQSEPINDAVIRITNDKIDIVAPKWAMPDGERSSWIDFGPNSTALPGLVDAHTHFTLLADGRSYEAMAAASDEVLARGAARNAAIHLRAGVTTARDNGARSRLGFVLREAIDQGLVEGPRLLVCGRPVTRTGGHFHWCNGTADGEDGIRKAIRLLVDEGADHIKIMASGGGTAGTNPGRASYTVPELQVATRTAHDLGRLTTAHCRAAEAMSRAIDAGLDCIEHGEFMLGEGGMVYDVELAKRLVHSELYLSPTLQSSGWDTILRLRSKKEESRLDYAEEALLAATEEKLKTRLEHFNRLLSLGMGPRIVCGTDAGCFDYSFGHMDYGISLMIEGGMTPMEALKSATSVAAEACGVSATVGSLESGKRADVLIVDGDPLTDISSVGRPLAVFKHGRRIPGLADTPSDESL
jgi:imidazolonepropionase-like amidohydrolase